MKISQVILFLSLMIFVMPSIFYATAALFDRYIYPIIEPTSHFADFFSFFKKKQKKAKLTKKTK